MTDFEERVSRRLRSAEWHPFRPVKVFRVCPEAWIVALRYGGGTDWQAFDTQAQAFQAAERCAQMLRECNPCPRA